MVGWLRKIFDRFSRNPHSGVYAGLRSQAISMQRCTAGIPTPAADAPVWGMLMEIGYAGASATLFALADGTTSLYTSTGGGIIGGQAHENVREANAELLATANKLFQHLKPTSSFPVPQAGHTIFYALTDSGAFFGEARDEDLGENRHILSPLFHAGHGVLTQLRLISGG